MRVLPNNQYFLLYLYGGKPELLHQWCILFLAFFTTYGLEKMYFTKDLITYDSVANCFWCLFLIFYWFAYFVKPYSFDIVFLVKLITHKITLKYKYINSKVSFLNSKKIIDKQQIQIAANQNLLIIQMSFILTTEIICKHTHNHNPLPRQDKTAGNRREGEFNPPTQLSMKKVV